MREAARNPYKDCVPLFLLFGLNVLSLWAVQFVTEPFHILNEAFAWAAGLTVSVFFAGFVTNVVL